MPALYQDRAGISLFSAQWSTGEQQPIPEKTIQQVVFALQRFRATCKDFGVKDESIRLIATEATRVALNSKEFTSEIKSSTGIDVEMLPKEEEGRIGAHGIASSFIKVKGLVMDLGGGSTQITWMLSEDGEVRMSEKGSVSMPYGAAALSIRLDEANHAGKKAVEELRREIVNNFKSAVTDINLPPELQGEADESGLALYLSGGGFRGWGFVLMSQHPVQPYPIPIINGFKTTPAAFKDTEMVQAAVHASQNTEEDSIFRVSARRASQVPAVAFLVSCLAEALPTITNVHFCQGGVREGSLYSTLPPKTRAEHPLVVATSAIAPHSAPKLLELIQAATPLPSDSSTFPGALISTSVLTAFVRSLYVHASLLKDLRAAAALRYTVSGQLAGLHGIGHMTRAALALLLCERWGGRGSLPPSDEDFYTRLLQLVGAKVAWWCAYIGRVGALVAEMCPAGVVGAAQDVATITSSWKKLAKGPHESVAGGEVKLEVAFRGNEDVVLLADALQKALKLVDKVGKRKHWPRPEFGHEVDLKVFTEEGKLKGKRWKGKEMQDGQAGATDMDMDD
ncbi:hypothetical protein LTS18_003835 [Coniosporium uncinatum]|uniref:Uncharacterized protein n=1 Tax=Coniosporium uncinatum TaxID=93489 RepID=A0ACC3DT07_9PEZI|nr:hypothetical protein LTS18_003835 [Coniosporium uncinatum]